jgi:hypothetical protein
VIGTRVCESHNTRCGWLHAYELAPTAFNHPAWNACVCVVVVAMRG